MFKSITEYLMRNGALPRSAEYRATHHLFSPTEFAQYAFPEQCVVCLATPVTHIWSEPTAWGTVADRGDHQVLTSGNLPPKAVPYCHAHVPAPDAVKAGKGNMPGFAIKTKTSSTALEEVILCFDNPAYLTLMKAEARRVWIAEQIAKSAHFRSDAGSRD